MATLSTAVDLLTNSVSQSDQKIKTTTDLHISPMYVNVWIKSEVALHMVDFWKGPNNFPHTPSGSLYSSVITMAVEKFMGITSVPDVIKRFNNRVQLGQSTVYVITYLESPSSRFHDSVLTKFCNAFFAGMPDDNRLSSNARMSQRTEEDFTRRFERLQPVLWLH